MKFSSPFVFALATSASLAVGACAEPPRATPAPQPAHPEPPPAADPRYQELPVPSAGTPWTPPAVDYRTLPNGVGYDTIDDGPSQGDNFGPIRIPPGRLFLMGDNRDHSADSRFSLAEQGLGGPVPIENIGGRAEFITFSLNGTTMLTNPATWLAGFREGRAGTSLRPPKD